MAGPFTSPLEPSHAQAPTGIGPTRVLLVDDDRTTRLLIRALLEHTGKIKIVGEAENGAQGVAMAASLRPDVVVLDVEMPVMDGRQALPLIRQASANAKIIVFSDVVGGGFESPDDRLQADLLISKGIDCSTLVPAILCMARGDKMLASPRLAAGGKRAAS